MKKNILIKILLILIGLCSFKITYNLKKRISDKEYRYEFYTTTKEKNALEKRNYYWFKGGAIHNSEYGIGGELLDGEFQKFYHSNQLAESGKFKEGLKTGRWKKWYENGVLKEIIYWSKGKKKGRCYFYDNEGLIMVEGKFRNNKKTGRWVNFKNQDTTYYKKDTVFIKTKKTMLKTQHEENPVKNYKKKKTKNDKGS